MEILFIGGTQFVGRHMVAAALARGHKVTLFNRGKSNPGLFPEVEKIIGDRDGGLAPLQGRRWDAVVDVNGYVPRLVRDSARLLKGSVGQYVFVSTGSVYDFQAMKLNGDENTQLVAIEDPNTEEWNGPAYGWLKVLCEQAVSELYPDNSLILRLGVVAGPYDPTDRITYWVTRVARGGEMLVPVKADQAIQFIDARDLADFTMLGIENHYQGIFNTIGNSISWQCFLDACAAASRSNATFTFVDDPAFIRDNIDLRAKPYGVFPMVLPPELAYVWTMNSDKALNAGMVYRSALNTARDTLVWDFTRPATEERQTGLDPDKEREVLDKWKAQSMA